MAKTTDAIAWLKRQFAGEIAAAIEGTPFSADLITAIAMQETYSIWGNLYEILPVDELLALCTGDTLDAPRRSAFPKTKASLIAETNGERMFAIARRALEDVAEHIPAYRQVAHKKPQQVLPRLRHLPVRPPALPRQPDLLPRPPLDELRRLPRTMRLRIESSAEANVREQKENPNRRGTGLRRDRVQRRAGGLREGAQAGVSGWGRAVLRGGGVGVFGRGGRRRRGVAADISHFHG
jgi:hypothetical protein